MPQPYQPHFEPVPDLASVVKNTNFRFTVLTDRLIRMEYSTSGQFEDRASQVFWFRHQPVPIFTSRFKSDKVEIETEYMLLDYQISERGFTPNTLQIQVKSTGAHWKYGDPISTSRNLKGTARTLDGAIGATHLDYGLISRQGWSVIDDSGSLVFNNEGWLEPRRTPGGVDLYFLGYGNDYSACLQDFCRVAGPVPLIPRWILGNWWSRYWKYSADELLALMDEFKHHKAPLSVCIVDMDWHLTETNNTSTGWTGYTWNRALFPDPTDFIQKLHQLGLRTALNLHPAEGIHSHEEQYEKFALSMGLDPSKKDPIAFDPVDPMFIRNYFELLHHPYEDQGVDFWWLDWQQGTQTRVFGLDPLWWLNHLHFYDLARDGIKRPFIFSRWGGLGNHRYPIGFSGDTVIGWEALKFQPRFTATAANVGYGWWSHDIGGHMGGIECDELYTRWVQYGVFSPILRLHSTSNHYLERRPWGRGPQAKLLAIRALRLRHQLIPYLYSMAWRNTITGLPPITPIYYSHPNHEEAYRCPQAYWFGSELIAAPFTSPADPQSCLSRQIVWLPEMHPGDNPWFHLFTKETFEPGWHTIFGTLEDIPVFARPGAILPLGPDTGEFGAPNPAHLFLHVFPGADNHFELYEDDGETLAYRQGFSAVTPFDLKWGKNYMEFSILPVRGNQSLIPHDRVFSLHLHGLVKPNNIEFLRRGEPVIIEHTYQTENHQLVVGPFQHDPTTELVVRLSAADDLVSAVDTRMKKLQSYLNVFRMNTYLKLQIDQEWPQIISGELSLASYPDLTKSQAEALSSLL